MIPLDLPDALQNADEPLVCRFGPHDKNSVSLDLATGTVELQNCHVPGKLLACIQSDFSCSINDVLLVYRFQSRWGETLEIVTKFGAARVPFGASNYTNLYAQLRSCVPDGRPGAEIYKPVMAFGAFWFAVFGIFLGWFLTPVNGSNAVLGAFLTLGAVIGLVVPFFVVWFADHVLKVSIAAPVSLAVFGACLALLISSSGGWNHAMRPLKNDGKMLEMPLAGWDGSVFFIATLLGGAAGLMIWGLSRLIQRLSTQTHNSVRYEPDSVPPNK